ncbi:nuclear receptor-interacting protein 2 [Gastrophryne carolinensis]
MSCQKLPIGHSDDANIRGSPKKEQDLRGAATLRQQRRLKQATQFLHKDSADLLPLDQLRRLGTSKDLQPHTLVQRRLLGDSPVKEACRLAQPLHPEAPPTGTKVQPTTRSDEDSSTTHDPDDPPAPNNPFRRTPTNHCLLISCKVCAQDVCSKLCVERRDNFISRSCVQRLGLQPSADLTGRVTVDIEVGEEKLTSSAVIVDDNSAELSIGLDTLIQLKSCIDLEHGVLKTPTRAIPFLAVQSETEKTSAVSHPGEP